VDCMGLLVKLMTASAGGFRSFIAAKS
jgi:hypothetical protein